VGRKKGSRNKDFEEERRAISERTAGFFFSGASEVPSFRELAKIAGVTPTTLRHYCPTRDQLLVAALEVAHESGKDEIARAAGAGEELPPLGASMTGYLNHFVFGFHAGVGHLLSFGLSAGLGNASVGPAFVGEVLEPTLVALEERLAVHGARGELVACDTRLAALSLVSPVLVALLHQFPLGGATCRPLDVQDVIAEQVKRFVRAYGKDDGGGGQASSGSRAPAKKRSRSPRA
jgi:AcrR family transcriptional regulator